MTLSTDQYRRRMARTAHWLADEANRLDAEALRLAQEADQTRKLAATMQALANANVVVLP